MNSMPHMALTEQSYGFGWSIRSTYLSGEAGMRESPRGSLIDSVIGLKGRELDLLMDPVQVLGP